MIEEEQAGADKRKSKSSAKTQHSPSVINVPITLMGHDVPTFETAEKKAKPNQESGD